MMGTTPQRADEEDAADPVRMIRTAPMSRRQILAVLIFFLLYALDGYDLLSLAFALPGIRTSMNLAPDALGLIISIGLIGTGMGALLISPLGDRLGRKKLMIGCLLSSTIGMAFCAMSSEPILMAAGRFITGIGVGGLLPAVTALATEYTSERYRSRVAAFITVGFPAGGFLGGAIASRFLLHYSWHSIFWLGVVTTGLMTVVTAFAVPESVEFLADRRRPGDLERVNATLRTIGLSPVSRFHARQSTDVRRSVLDILKPGLIGVTLTITLCYAFHNATFYYSVNWLPKIATDLSLTPAAAASLAGWCSAGGMAGAALVAWLAPRIDVRILTPLMLLGSAACLFVLPLSGEGGRLLVFNAVLLGMCLYGGQAGLYASMMRAFPVHVRATGAGFVTGAGRLGGILAPGIAGLLFANGLGNLFVGAVMALGSLTGAVFWLVSGMTRLRTTPAVSRSPGDDEPLRGRNAPSRGI